MNYGYNQKGNRYHWRINGQIITSVGFKSKANCDEWIDEQIKEDNLDWRVGFMVKFKSEDCPWYLVNKNGEEIKAF